MFWYSLAKRFTQLHAGLPRPGDGGRAGRRLARRRRAGGGSEPWLLGLAIGTWVGGFDVLYACQDLEFDRAHGLRSIPVRFGVAAVAARSRARMHVVTVVCLAALGVVAGLGLDLLAGVAGVGAAAGLRAVARQRDDLSQVKRAFDLNG